FEEGEVTGGAGERFGSALCESGFTGEYRLTGVKNEFVHHAPVERLLKEYKLDANSMAEMIENE
ncbi:MAG: hypothetical protein IKN56_01930, partial [Clostridia bacterium]|nr:hypothetical protein [Clostridia bacterium]